MRKIFLFSLLILMAIGQAEARPDSTMSEIVSQENSGNNSEENDELEELKTAMKNAGLQDDVINECIDEIQNGRLMNLIDTSSLRSLDSDFSFDIFIDQYANPNERYECKIRSAPSSIEAIVQSVKMHQPFKLESLSDITYDDFVLYSILEKLKIETSYTEVTPGGRIASHSYKLKNAKKFPESTVLLDQFSNLKAKLPADYTLDMIYLECAGENNWKEEKTIEEWKNKIGEKEFQKIWQQFLKQFKINL